MSKYPSAPRQPKNPANFGSIIVPREINSSLGNLGSSLGTSLGNLGTSLGTSLGKTKRGTP